MLSLIGFQMEGICGDNDGDKSNEFINKLGIDVSTLPKPEKYAEMGDPHWIYNPDDHE